MTNKSLDVIRGDDKYYVINVKDGDGVAVDITGWVIFFTVKVNFSDTDHEAIISKTIMDHFDAAVGISKIHLTNEETNYVGVYYYDIQIKRPNDDVPGTFDIFTVLSGEIEFKQDVTQRISEES